MKDPGENIRNVKVLVPGMKILSGIRITGPLQMEQGRNHYFKLKLVHEALQRWLLVLFIAPGEFLHEHALPIAVHFRLVAVDTEVLSDVAFIDQIIRDDQDVTKGMRSI